MATRRGTLRAFVPWLEDHLDVRPRCRNQRPPWAPATLRRRVLLERADSELHEGPADDGWSGSLPEVGC